MFIRVMKHAALAKENPFEAATRFSSRLFAKAPPPLGLEPETEQPEIHQREGKAVFGLAAMVTQIRNAAGEWEEKHTSRFTAAPLKEVWAPHGEGWGPALSNPRFVSGLGAGIARPFKMTEKQPNGALIYGLELALGQVAPEDENFFRPTKAIRKIIGLDRKIEFLLLPEFQQEHWHKIAPKLLPPAAVKSDENRPPLEPAGVRDGLVMGRCDLRDLQVQCYREASGICLLSPEERTLLREAATEVEAHPSSPDHAVQEPKSGSPIHSWRALGLIDHRGAPTRRGEIFSFFQHGEGLAISAALEDETYPLDELIVHLANLRAGVRFEIPGVCGSERLAACCRKAYGFVCHEGYLESGLPVDYGEGAAEVIGSLLHHERIVSPDGPRSALAEGDVSRVYIEWLSLIRHVVHVPAHPWERWQKFQKACSDVLDHHTAATRHLFHLDLPPLTNKQRDGRPKHYLMARA